MSSTTLSSDRLDFQRGVEQEKLTERDVQMIHRYLSDPSVFPREFKRWITEHSSDTVDIAKTQVHGLVNDSGQVVIGGASMAVLGAALAGCLIPYAAPLAPEGWLLCDGRELARADYVTLFGLIGTVWGTPSTGTVFKIPDLRGRTPFGVDGNVPFGLTDGLAAGARGPKHHHRFLDTESFAAAGWNTLDGNAWGTVDGSGQHAHTYRRHTESGGQGGTQGGTVGLPGGFDASTSDNGWHDHWANLQAQVAGQVNVSGQVTMDANTHDAGGPKDTVGWAGMNWIMGSGKVS